MKLDSRVKEIFNQSVVGSTIGSIKAFPLLQNTKIISDPELCMGLVTNDFDIPDKYISFPWAEYVTRRRITKFSMLTRQFIKETGFLSVEGAAMSADDYLRLYNQTLIPYERECSFFANTFENKLPKALKIKPIKGNIKSLLSYLVLYVGLKRELNTFAESCLACFAAGGIPCGWDGEYPDGKIICYWAHDDEPTFENNQIYPWQKYMSGED